MKFTLTEIAELSGNSKSAVSSALNNKGTLSAETRKRIKYISELPDAIDNDFKKSLFKDMLILVKKKMPIKTKNRIELLKLIDRYLDRHVYLRDGNDRNLTKTQLFLMPTNSLKILLTPEFHNICDIALSKSKDNNLLRFVGELSDLSKKFRKEN